MSEDYWTGGFIWIVHCLRRKLHITRGQVFVLVTEIQRLRKERDALAAECADLRKALGLCSLYNSDPRTAEQWLAEVEKREKAKL